MRKLFVGKVALALAALICSGAVSACGSAVFRTYYMDYKNCTSYYNDAMGNRVVTGYYNGTRFEGLTMHQDARGRWFYQDSWGNRVYKTNRCS